MRKGFQLQKLYWGDNSSLDYETQKTLTSQLKSELETIRDKYREEIKLADELVGQFDINYTDQTLNDRYYELMKTISVGCSHDMKNFARRVIERSVQVLNTKPLCDFEAVAIGSIARGEATPFSDLEFLFLIERHTEETVGYFEMLAMTSYLIMGNLVETK